MTKHMILNTAALAAIAALFPCGMLASAAGNNAETQEISAQTETVETNIPAAGGITHEGTDDENFSTCTYTYFVPDDAEYGDLTDEEIEELNGLYERLESLNSGTFTDEDAEEADAILARMTELETKAGWVYEFTEDDLKSQLSPEAYAEYQQITDEIDKLNARLGEILGEAGFSTEYQVDVDDCTAYAVCTYSDEE